MADPLAATVAAAMRIAAAEEALLEAMGQALDRGDVDEVIRCARLLTGRDGGSSAEGDRARPRLQRIPGGR